MAQHFATALKLAKAQRAVLGNSAVALLTGSFEQIYQSATFKCPCSPGVSQIYAATSLLVPALVLLAMGYSANARTWKLVTGCCSFRPLRGFGGLRRFLRILLSVTGRALVAPGAWLLVALFDGSYFVCGASPYAAQVRSGFLGGWLPTVVDGLSHLPEPLAKMNHSQLAPVLAALPCRRPEGISASSSDQILRQLAIQSQLWGWFLLATAVVLAMSCSCLAHCTAPVSYLHLQYWRGYIEAEGELFQKRASEHSRELASKNVDRFFQRDVGGSPLASSPSINDWSSVSRLYVFHERQPLRYSTLDSWAQSGAPQSGAPQKGTPQKGGAASPDGEIEPSLAFVDGTRLLRLRDALSVDSETEPLNGDAKNRLT
ncbi:calcium homeostasis modulator protein 6-like [Lampetra fluviatilis]